MVLVFRFLLVRTRNARGGRLETGVTANLAINEADVFLQLNWPYDVFHFVPYLRWFDVLCRHPVLWRYIGVC